MRILLEKLGVREFRQLMSRYRGKAWYSQNTDMKNLSVCKGTDTFALLKDTITNYEPLKLVAFPL